MAELLEDKFVVITHLNHSPDLSRNGGRGTILQRCLTFRCFVNLLDFVKARFC